MFYEQLLLYQCKKKQERQPIRGPSFQSVRQALKRTIGMILERRDSFRAFNDTSERTSTLSYQIGIC
jgi:hypothetical protein